jgi:outer membrane lipoprotein
MAKKRCGRLSLLFFLLVFSSYGCSHVISSEMRQIARKDVSFPTVLQNPTAFLGSTLILGGVIIETINRTDGTSIMILETPLDSRDRPTNPEYSRGRFIARTSGFLDEEIYSKGKMVSLAGEIIGKEVRPLGEIYYTYPLLQVRELVLIERNAYPWYYPTFSFGFGYYF